MAKAFSFIYRQLVKWFLGSVWPWFVGTVWPHIKKLLNEILEQVFRTAQSRYDEWANSRARTREESATKEAAEADKKAQQSQSESEAQKHRAVAEVWRQVADQFRQENEELRAKLNEVLQAAKAEFSDELNAANIENVIQECDDGTLKLSGSGAQLALPTPTDENLERFMAHPDDFDFDTSDEECEK